MAKKTKNKGAGLTPPPPFDQITTAEAVKVAGEIAANNAYDLVRYPWNQYTKDLIEFGYLDGEGNLTDQGKEWLKDAY